MERTAYDKLHTDTTNEQAAKAQKSEVTRKDYALRRMMVAMDRVIAAKTNAQRRSNVAWASLWHKHWKSLSNETKQAPGERNDRFTQA